MNTPGYEPGTKSPERSRLGHPNKPPKIFGHLSLSYFDEIRNPRSGFTMAYLKTQELKTTSRFSNPHHWWPCEAVHTLLIVEPPV
jgi:hypothetical protein